MFLAYKKKQDSIHLFNYYDSLKKEIWMTPHIRNATRMNE